jgi:hypothetical protein
MLRPKTLGVVVALAALGLGVSTAVRLVDAQSANQPKAERPAYQPAVPAPSINVSGGGWGGYSSPGTAAGSAMNGMASMMSAAGNYNLSTSAAAINMTQAEHNQLENDMLATDTYFQMRSANKKYREAEAGPKPTMEQLVRISKEGAPRQLASSQMDPVSGTLNWPVVLQDDNYKAPRQQVDELFAKRASQGGLNYPDQSSVKSAVESMFATLKSQIRDIPPQDYVTSRSFLNSVVYAAAKTDL